MKVKLLLIAAALLMLASVSFGQSAFTACMSCFSFQLNDRCDSSTPLPDGTPIMIMYDANSNGPDAADVPATVCDLPPQCPTGPAGTVNFNQFTINGGAFGVPGGFYTDPCFGSILTLPVPATYYLKITTPNVIWVSNTVTMVSGPQDVDFSNWTCSTPPNPCTPVPADRQVTFAPVTGNAQDQSACITLCHAYPTVTVCVGPTLEGRLPEVLTNSDCQCDAQGHHAAGYSFNGATNGGWVWNAATMSYCQQITLPDNGTEGCVNLHFDFILAAEMGNIAFTASDNAVNLKFNTLSESNVSKFEVRRDGELVTTINATNSPTGHEYTYTDGSALNGRTYSYTLVSINVDGTSHSYAPQAVTPSMYNAVVTEYALHQNFPNPFNPTTSIRFDLVDPNFVSLKIYNANGQEVANVVNKDMSKGVHIVNFDATNLTSGLYFYTVKVGNVYSATKKMLLVK